MPETAKYNILFLDHGKKLVGGGQINTLSLIKCLDKTIFNPVVLSSADNVFTEEARNMKVEVRLLQYPSVLTSTYRRNVSFSPVSLVCYTFSVLALVLNLSRFIKANNIHLVHPCDNISRVAGGIAAKLAGVPAVCQITDDFENTFTNRALRAVILLCMERVMPVSDKVGGFFRVGPKGEAKVKTIYTGIDLDCFDPAGAKSEVRKEFSIAPGDVLIGIVGLLQPIKGHSELFHALALLKKAHVHAFRCLVVGDGPELESLKELAGRLGLSAEIIFTGFRKDISALMKGIDMLVAPSRSEASSRVLLEAGALKLPVVGTRVGGIPEMIEDGSSGFLVPLDDVAALAEAIRKLFDPVLRKRMGEAGRTRIENKFSNQKITEQVEQVYCSVLGNAR